MKNILIFVLLVSFGSLFGQEHHHEASQDVSGWLAGWLGWSGKLHPVILHFPIALIICVMICEVLNIFFPSQLFPHAARFMIVAAALTAVPTAFTGLQYARFHEDVSTAYLLGWHQWMGLSTAAMAIICAVTNYFPNCRRGYLVGLFLLTVFVSVTAYIGGEITFGPNHLFATEASH